MSCIKIEHLDDLEMAGVLVISGKLDSFEDLFLSILDVSNVPSNILNSLSKVVRSWLCLDNVTGLKVSMLENLTCEDLCFEDVVIPAQVVPKVSVEYCRNLAVSGNLSGLLDSITCDRLFIEDMTRPKYCLRIETNLILFQV